MFGSPKRKPFIQTAQLSTLVAEGGGDEQYRKEGAAS